MHSEVSYHEVLQEHEVSRVLPHVVGHVVGKLVVNLIDHLRDGVNEHVLLSSMAEQWKALDPHGWTSKYVCFGYLGPVLFTMSQSSLIENTDTCNIGLGQDFNLKEKLFKFAQKARHITAQLLLSRESQQSQQVWWSASLTNYAEIALGISEQLMQCFTDAVRRERPTQLSTHVFRMAEEALGIIQSHGTTRMDSIGMDFATTQTAEEPGECEKSANWAKGSWRITCLTAAACAKMGFPSAGHRLYTVAELDWYAWLGGAAGKTFRMALAEEDAPFPKHGGWGETLSPTWRVKCTEGMADQISLDDGQHWFTWTGHKYLYVADFSDATDPEKVLWEGTLTNALIEKVE